MANAMQQVQVLYPSAARTTHANKAFSGNGFRNIRIDIDITAFTGTSITFKVQYFDDAKQAYVDLGVTTAALSATGHSVLQFGLDTTTVASTALDTVVPRRLQLVPSGTITSVTYSVIATKQ